MIVFAFLLPVVWSSSVFNWFTSPKSALALVALGPGLVVLVWLVLRHDVAALAAGGFLVAAGVATAVAHEPMMSLVGEYFAQNGLLLTAACVACWALGRTLDGRARPVLVLALIAAAGVNAAVAWLQMGTDLGVQALAPAGGRAAGLMGNPVQLAALGAAALWLAAARERDADRPLVWWAVLVLLAGSVELSGSRIALALVVVTVLWHAGAHLARGGWRRAFGVLVATGLGVVLAMAVGGASTTSGRVQAAGSSGLGTRADMWGSSLEALADRPLLGYGPGRYQSVSSPRRTLAIARYEGPDVLYSDAHNLVVEYAVATGAIGFGLLALWLYLSARRARGPLAGFCALAAIVGLLQPQYVGITPLVALALGGAMARAPTPRLSDAPRWAVRTAVAAAAVLAVGGLVAGASLVVGDVHYARAISRLSVPELDAAAGRLPPWPQLSAVRTQLLPLRSPHPRGDATKAAVTAQARETIARDREDPTWWTSFGSLMLQRHELARADAAYQQALERNPWSFYGLAGSYRVADERRDRAAAAAWRTRLCRLGKAYCPSRSGLPPAPDRAEPSVGGE